MNELELAIYEAEINGDIDSYTSDTLMGIITEGANLDALGIKRCLKKECKETISYAKKLYKVGNYAEADAKIAAARKSIVAGKSAVAQLNWNVGSTITQIALAPLVLGIGLSIMDLMSFLSGAVIQAAAFAGVYSKNPTVQAVSRKITNAAASETGQNAIRMTKSVTEIAKTVKYLKLIIASINSKKEKGEEITVKDLNVIKGGVITALSKYDKALVDVQKSGHELANKRKNSGKVAKESVLEDIYEAELCGEITPEERMALIDYMNI